jgi:hypothetical protein
MTRRLLLGAGVAAALLVQQGWAAEPPAPACDLPADLLTPAPKLAGIRQWLRPGARLEVLALGSGSLLGLRGGVEGSVPFYMVEAMRAAAPGAVIRLTLHGARAATAAEMLVALRKELAAHPYQLVLWQTGTAEALRNTPAADFARTLADGAAAVAAAGAALVLVDVPFSRLLEARSDLAPYRSAMDRIASQSEAVLFRRYELMHRWADTGDIDLEAAGKHERHGTADRLRACLGQALAELVLADRGS